MLLAARLYGKISIPRQAPSWLGDAHRLTGTAAFAVTLPVAYQCRGGSGSRPRDHRVLLHGIFGCAFFGAFTIKVLGVRLKGLPNWVLPVAGGLVFAALVGIFLTSSLWFFTSSASAPADLLSMFARVVNAVEVLAAIGVLVFVIMLFANEPGGSGAARASSPGAQLFAANCASCHGANGEGVIGPKLAGGAVVRDFPNEADQIAFVAKGRGEMPSFACRALHQELQEVVEYTRTGLGK